MKVTPGGYAPRIAVSFVAGSTNESNVLFEVLDAEGNAVEEPYIIRAWLSDAATGLGLTGTATSSAAAIVSGFGSVFTIQTAKKDWFLQTNADGQAKLLLTDSSETLFYACATDPRTAVAVVSELMVAGDWG